MAPCFVRAPTDNDAGGSGGSAHAARWLQMGLDRLCVTHAAVSLTERRSDLVTVQVRRQRCAACVCDACITVPFC